MAFLLMASPFNMLAPNKPFPTVSDAKQQWCVEKWWWRPSGEHSSGNIYGLDDGIVELDITNMFWLGQVW